MAAGSFGTPEAPCMPSYQFGIQSAFMWLLVLLWSSLGALAGDIEQHTFVGWKGDTWQADIPLDSQASQDDTEEVIAPKGSQHDSKHKKEPWIETLSWSPRMFLYHGFLTKEECDYLINLGEQRVKRSMVVDTATGVSKLDDIRTSWGGAFMKGEDPVISEVEQRIAEWTHLPPSHGEPMQILRYMNGQEYRAHWDYFSDPQHEKRKDIEGNRYATVLMYLAEVEEGGETLFPLATPIDAEAQAIPHPSQCASRMGMAVRPRAGDAVLFFDMDIQGQKGDRKALHASCPTLKGTKWTMTCWIHSKPYGGKFDALEKAGQCTDTGGRHCTSVKREGLCDDPANIGPTGKCRKTCGDCVPCHAGDVLCYRANMRGRKTLTS